MLTPKAQALKDGINKSRRVQDKALLDVLAMSRNVVPLLRDKGLPSVADELARQIHIYDCEIEESVKFLTADGGMEAMLEWLNTGTNGGDNSGR